MPPTGEWILTGFIFAAGGYLLGSLPFSVWIGRGFFGTDVREHGSGNAGATNTWRVLGWKAGLPVLLLDMGKGMLATCLPLIHASFSASPEFLLWLRILSGAAAAGGHIWPVFAGFRGGKAVATLFGVLLGLMPLPALLSLAVFLAVFFLFRIVSLGSIVAGLSLPFLVWFMTLHPVQLMSFSILISLVVLLTHRRNIGRLLRGEEARLTFRKPGRDSG
jgi:glycerol-3-phosphate acyltransferase PlsY